MANYCHCGHSRILPYCDGSHTGRGLAPRAGEAAAPKPETPPAPASEPSPPPAPERAVSAAPAKGWLARLFGRG